MAKTATNDPIVSALRTTIDEGLAAIEEANKTLLAEDKGTPVKDIDKALKAGENIPEDIAVQWKTAEEAYKVYKENIDAARNAYRTNVLHEEAKDSTGDVNVETVKEARQVVMNALTFVKGYAQQNGLDDVVQWANTLSVPQVGRQGSSTVGAKKPRVLVKIGDVVHDSFSAAALALSTKEKKVTAGELAEAWNSAGGNEGAFTFGDTELLVTFKPKKSDSK